MAAQFDFYYVWNQSGMRPYDRKNQKCRILTYGGKNTVLVEFELDGHKMTTSRNAIRRHPISRRPRVREILGLILKRVSGETILNRSMGGIE